MDKEFKSVDIEIFYENVRKNMKVNVQRSARVNFGTETSFAQVEEFLEEFQKVIQCLKYCVRNAVFCKVYLSSAVYERSGTADTLKSISFNGWKFEGIPSEVDGMYLSPDLQYTSEEHDIWIDFTQPLLSQLAEAHI